MNIATHIDSLLMIVFGVFFTFVSFRKVPIKGARIFRICGPALVVIGIILLFAQPSRAWARHATDDGFASAEFPGKPTGKETVGTVGGVSLPRVAYTYTVPGEDITLILSRSPLMESGATDEERIAGMVAFFSQQGFELAERQSVQCGDVQGHFVKLRNKNQGSTVLVRFALANTNVYRALASFTSAGETQEEIRRFVESFQVRK